MSAPTADNVGNSLSIVVEGRAELTVSSTDGRGGMAHDETLEGVPVQLDVVSFVGGDVGGPDHLRGGRDVGVLGLKLRGDIADIVSCGDRGNNGRESGGNEEPVHERGSVSVRTRTSISFSTSSDFAARNLLHGWNENERKF